MYTIYLFREKKTNNIIYVGSSARPSARMKEHIEALRGSRKQAKIHKYLLENNLKLYKDVEIVWCDVADTRDEMYSLEEMYFYKYQETLLNDRPGENRHGDFNPKRRKVLCVNEDKIFNSICECARYYNKGRTTICRVLTRETDYTWINGEKYVFKFVS